MKTSFSAKSIAVIAVSILFFASCKDDKPHFTIEGIIDGADTTMLYLERRSLTETVIIDSIKLGADGSFKFKEPALGYPEFYLLRMGDHAINIAVDSIESIAVNTTKASFATDYLIEGSEASLKIKDIVFEQQTLSKKIAELKAQYVSEEITQEEYITKIQKVITIYKEKASGLILSDNQSLAGYFALFQKVEGYLIFDPYDKKDLSFFRSVATGWDVFKKKSPRAEHLKKFTLSALAETKAAQRQEEALKKIENTVTSDMSDYYNISLPDVNNKVVNTSSLKGKVVVLDFTSYQTEFSPAHNVAMNDIYNKHKGAVEIYQVSFDSDIHAWKNAAINLPWISVRDDKGLSSKLVARFNIHGIPTTFLLNKNGEIVKRILASDNLAAEVIKLL